jgi:hypothetical protein
MYRYIRFECIVVINLEMAVHIEYSVALNTRILDTMNYMNQDYGRQQQIKQHNTI